MSRSSSMAFSSHSLCLALPILKRVPNAPKGETTLGIAAKAIPPAQLDAGIHFLMLCKDSVSPDRSKPPFLTRIENCSFVPTMHYSGPVCLYVSTTLPGETRAGPVPDPVLSTVSRYTSFPPGTRLSEREEFFRISASARICASHAQIREALEEIPDHVGLWITLGFDRVFTACRVFSFPYKVD